jgi:excisionase family DNA binding protein
MVKKTRGPERGSAYLLTPAEAAEFLGVSASYLAKARMNGTGPRFIKLGRSVRYRLPDLEDFLRTRSRTSTSERPV